MPVPAFSQWLHADNGYESAPDAPNVHHGPMPFARDTLDARRMMTGNYTPEAAYPDGYLGTIVSRRDDRLLNSVKDRAGKRSYTRGVHKGERVDPSDYYWDPTAITADDGILRGMAAVYTGETFLVQRMAPTGNEVVKLAQRDKLPVDDVPVATPNPNGQLARMKPPWR